MKLKTLFGGQLFAAAIMTASSCEEMFKQMANVPSFFIPEVMYNGQSYQITRLATCKYEFTTDSKYLKVVENEDGKFIATASGDWVDETSKEFVEVNVTAVNPDNSSVEPQVEQTVLHDWNIKVFYGDTEVNPIFLNAETVYTLKMYDKLTGTPVDSLPGSFNDKDNVQKLYWNYSSSAIEELETTATSMEFKTLKAGSKFSVTVSLGSSIKNISMHTNN